MWLVYREWNILYIGSASIDWLLFAFYIHVWVIIHMFSIYIYSCACMESIHSSYSEESVRLACMTSSYLPYTADSYGLFLPSEDLSRGVWLQPGRTLEYYGLKTGVSVSLLICLI